MKKTVYKIVRLAALLVAMFITYNLGKLHGESEYLKRIIDCVKIIDYADLKTYYDHDIFVGSLFNHAEAHNANIYMKCIWKDFYK